MCTWALFSAWPLQHLSTGVGLLHWELVSAPTATWFLYAVTFGKTKGETGIPQSELSKFMELWLEESHKHGEEWQKEEYKEQWHGKWEEWRWMEEERAWRSEEIMRKLAAHLAECEPRRPRTEFGVDLLKLTKLTLSDDTEVFMTTFKRSMKAHKIEIIK